MSERFAICEDTEKILLTRLRGCLVFFFFFLWQTVMASVDGTMLENARR